MPYFFIHSSGISGSKCVIAGKDFHHLARVRRIRQGDEINLRTEQGVLLRVRIDNVGDSEILAEILNKEESQDMPINLNLFVAVLKGRKFDFVIQKAVEIGVQSIVPVLTERTVPDIKDKEESKLNRWNRIAREAAKQSGRSIVPPVRGLSFFTDLISETSDHLKLLAHPGMVAGNLKEFIVGAERRDVSLLVGPEGGFSTEEIVAAKENDWKCFSLGFTCLRAETAAIVLPAILVYEWSAIVEDKSE